MRAKDSILDELVQEAEDKKKLSYWTGSFWDFEEVLKREKSKAIRTSVQHLTDAIKYFGFAKGEISGEVVPIYNVWQDRIESIVPDRERIFGMDRTLNKLVSYFETLAREEGKERIIILRGPPATAKSSLINLMMKALEFYSLSEEGRKYTFEWVFPKAITSGSIGYAISAGPIEEMNSGSYANMPDENIDAIIGCKMRDHPLLLLPKSQRVDYIKRLSEQIGTEIRLPYKLEEKQLCKNCQSIMDSLFEKNKGDLSKVMRHIRVKSYSLSQSSQRGMSTVISAQNPEGSAQVIMSKEPYAILKVSEKLKNIELHDFKGEWTDASNGIIHYQDIFDMRSEQSLKALLSAVEEHVIDFNGVKVYIDTIIFGSTNLYQYENFWRNDSNAGLKNRIRTIDIGYVLNPKEEEKIYLKQLVDEAGLTAVRNNNLEKHIVPHATYLAALWAVTTRLMPPFSFEDDEDGMLKLELQENLSKEEKEAIGELSPLEKAVIYDDEPLGFLSRESKEIFSRKHVKRFLRVEHEDLGERSEGMYGVDPRTMQNILTDVCSTEEGSLCLFPMQVLDRIQWMIGREKYNDFVSSMKDHIREHCDDKEHSSYGDSERLLDDVRDHYHELIEDEVKWAIIGMKKEEIDKRVRDYLTEVTAYVNKEQVQDPVTKEWKEPNKNRMEDIERYIDMGKSVDGVRIEYIRRIGTHSYHKRKELERVYGKGNTDAINREMNLTDDDIRSIFPEVYYQIENKMFEEKKSIMRFSIEELRTYIERYGTKDFEKLSHNAKDTVNRIISQLRQHQYCDHCGKETIIYAIENRLIK